MSHASGFGLVILKEKFLANHFGVKIGSLIAGKEIEKDCRLWYLDGEKWRMAKREQNDFRLPQSALTCTVSAASPLTECDGVLGITEGIQKPEEAQCRELNIHIW